MNRLSILNRLLDPVGALLSPEVAQRISMMKADDETQAHLDQLAAKSNEGLLSSAEQQEYRDYVDAIDLITVLQLKARSYLKSHPVS
jgi:hypothetical protein